MKPAIPDDVMVAAREALVEHHGTRNSMAAPSVHAGAFDSDPLVQIAARAIHAERQRCSDLVRAYPNFTALSDGDINRAGMVTRRTSHADIANAIQGAAP
jgi:hypothetical protein